MDKIFDKCWEKLDARGVLKNTIGKCWETLIEPSFQINLYAQRDPGKQKQCMPPRLRQELVPS